MVGLHDLMFEGNVLADEEVNVLGGDGTCFVDLGHGKILRR